MPKSPSTRNLPDFCCYRLRPHQLQQQRHYINQIYDAQPDRYGRDGRFLAHPPNCPARLVLRPKFFNNSYLIFPAADDISAAPHRGFPDTVEPETVKAEITRTILNHNQFDDVDVAREARREAAELLERWGIENPVRDELLDRLSVRSDKLAIIYDVCQSTVAQWARRTSGKHAIHSPTGLIVSRLRNFDLSSPTLDLAWVKAKYDAEATSRRAR